MGIRQFKGRIFFNDRIINLKVGGPVSDDGQQTVIAMDESTHNLRIIRCDVDSFNFRQLAEMIRAQFDQTGSPPFPSQNDSESLHH